MAGKEIPTRHHSEGGTTEAAPKASALKIIDLMYWMGFTSRDLDPKVIRKRGSKRRRKTRVFNWAPFFAEGGGGEHQGKKTNTKHSLVAECALTIEQTGDPELCKEKIRSKHQGGGFFLVAQGQCVCEVFCEVGRNIKYYWKISKNENKILSNFLSKPSTRWLNILLIT